MKSTVAFSYHVSIKSTPGTCTFVPTTNSFVPVSASIEKLGYIPLGEFRNPSSSSRKAGPERLAGIPDGSYCMCLKYPFVSPDSWRDLAFVVLHYNCI